MTIITIMVWGTTFISTKILLRHLQPIEILFYRFLMGYFALLLFYPKIHKVKNWKEELSFLGAGICGVTLYFLTENIALQYTLASNVGLLISVAPILTAILAHITTKDEKINTNIVVGFMIAFTGIFLIIFNGNFILKLNPIGDFLALSAAIAWSFYSVLLKKIGNKYNYIYITRKIFLYGLITTIPLLPLFKVSFSLHTFLLPSVLGNLLFLGFIGSALCFVLWNTAVNFIGVVKTSNYIYLIPLITLVLSVIILKEQVTYLILVGGGLILLGVYISEHGFNPLKSFEKLLMRVKK